MPANKYALLRYRIIDECLTNRGRPYPDLEDLRQACEERLYGSGAGRISVSTIEKDLWAMKNESDLGYLAPIKFSRTQGGYYYSEKDYTINKVSLSDDEREAIRLAATTLYQFRGMGIFDRFGSAIQKLFDRLQLPLDNAPLDRMVQFEHSPPAKGTELISPLFEAVRDHQELSFAYHSFVDDKNSLRIIRPYLLKEYRNRWYVIGLQVDIDQLRTFGLDRISNLKPTGRYFNPDPAFDPDALFRYSFGITAGGNQEDVMLRFDNLSARYVKSQPLHPTQQILAENESGITIKITVIPSYELRSTILSFGNSVSVISPATLCEEIESMKTKRSG